MGVRGYNKGEAIIMAEAMAKDPQHQGLNPQTWLTEPNTLNFVWDDAKEDNADGQPVYFWRVSNVWRIDIQFIPALNGTKTGKELVKGLRWLEKHARENGVREIIYDSVYTPLIGFMAGLGFKKVGENSYSKLL